MIVVLLYSFRLVNETVTKSIGLALLLVVVVNKVGQVKSSVNLTDE